MVTLIQRSLTLLFLIITSLTAFAKASEPLKFTVSMDDPGSHTFHVTLTYKPQPADSILLKLPNWTPGYYQLMDYAAGIQNFSPKDEKGNALKWVKSGKTGEITITPFKDWNRVATGLDSVSGTKFTYLAPDFDVLYDSPMLIGNLEELPSFHVKGIPHRFIGYKLGNFDKVKFTADIQKIVENASTLIGDIPYKHYTFIAIGPGQGGIEHLNSTTISFSGDLLNSRGWDGMMGFITHEYFHHYNVKRIRPIELGPFDYDKGSKTKMLWVSEGLTVYYEPLIMKAGGMLSQEKFLDFFKNHITNVETKPGRLFQTLAQASAETWSDGPFGRTGDAVNKTISYYQKGPVVGLLFDLAIRNETGNKKSLDDVMRRLYNDFYIKKKRGFTEAELRQTIESIAGKPLDELFSYIYTTAEPDYKKYLGCAGLDIDVTTESHLGTFEIRPRANSNALQQAIFEGWSRGR
jgi:predicted metalloprotease with PDZ domain